MKKTMTKTRGGLTGEAERLSHEGMGRLASDVAGEWLTAWAACLAGPGQPPEAPTDPAVAFFALTGVVTMLAAFDPVAVAGMVTHIPDRDVHDLMNIAANAVREISAWHGNTRLRAAAGLTSGTAQQIAAGMGVGGRARASQNGGPEA